MKERSLLSATAMGPIHRLGYVEWGEPDADRVVVCAHGMARNGRDFDALAERLSSSRRVVCPDMPGRGRSDWLAGPGPDGGYNHPQYIIDIMTLLARLDVEQVDWVGTSMGAHTGMILAGMPNSPIRRLVMNDIGAEVPGAFLDVLTGYIGLDKDFASLDDLEQYLRTIYVGFGDLTDEQWRHMAEHSQRRKPSGQLGLAYDPAIGRTLKAPNRDVVLWPLWEAVRCPVLLLRGENSPCLPEPVAQKMTETGPRATLVQVPGCGHAPALVTPAQLAIVETWLETDTLSP